MKLGCAAYSYRDYLLDQRRGPQQGRMSLVDFLDTAVELNLDGVELTSYYFPSTERAYLNNLKRQALFRGLEISGTAVGNNFCLPEEAERQAQVDMCKEWIEHSVILGSPCMRVFAGPVPEGHTEEEARAWCIECLREVVAHGEQHGVVIALENHGGITYTAEQVLKLLDAIQSDWLRANLDLGNFGPDPYDQFRMIAPYTVTTHAKVSWFERPRDPSSRRDVDYARVKEILEDVGYRGFISIEYEEPEDPQTGVPAFVRTLQSVFK